MRGQKMSKRWPTHILTVQLAFWPFSSHFDRSTRVLTVQLAFCPLNVLWLRISFLTLALWHINLGEMTEMTEMTKTVETAKTTKMTETTKTTKTTKTFLSSKLFTIFFQERQLPLLVNCVLIKKKCIQMGLGGISGKRLPSSIEKADVNCERQSARWEVVILF